SALLIRESLLVGAWKFPAPRKNSAGASGGHSIRAILLDFWPRHRGNSLSFSLRTTGVCFAPTERSVVTTDRDLTASGGLLCVDWVCCVRSSRSCRLPFSLRFPPAASTARSPTRVQAS